MATQTSHIFPAASMTIAAAPGLTHLNFESHKQEISVKGCLESFGLHTQFAWNPLDKIDTHGS